MTSKEAIDKIKHLLFGKELFSLMKTVEGMELKVEGELELGLPIYVITPEGEIPAADELYELEDGMKVRVKEGLIRRY